MGILETETGDDLFDVSLLTQCNCFGFKVTCDANAKEPVEGSEV